MRPILGIVLAVACLGVSLSAVEQVVLEEDTPAFHTLQGNVLLSERKYESAIGQYRRALALDAGYFYAQFNIALANQSIGRIDEARRWYEEALRSRPDNHEVVCNLGYLAFAAGDFEQAARRFQDAANLAAQSPSDSADYWFNLGSARERLGQWVEARRAYEGCLQISADHGPAHYNLGTLFLGPLVEETDSLARAQAHLEAALKIEPRRSEAWVNMGLVHERAGRNDDAKAAMTKAVEVATGPALDRSRWQQVRWFLRSVPPQRLAARDGLVAILASSPEFAEANGLLGQYYFQVGDYDLAIKHLTAEIAGPRFDPKSAVDRECHYLLALIYTDHRPDARKATEHASAYYELQPDSQKIHALRRRAFRLSEAAGVVPVDSKAPASKSAPTGSKSVPAPKSSDAAKPEAHPATHPAPTGSTPAQVEEKPTVKAETPAPPSSPIPADNGAPAAPKHGE
ncbi:MAG: tetratricopeptide repeat protein, partial [Planctomycetota bacterium]